MTVSYSTQLYTHTKSTVCMLPTIMPYIRLMQVRKICSVSAFTCNINIEAGHVDSNWPEFTFVFNLNFLFKSSSSSSYFS